jgi:hypothetical protein
MSVGKGATAFLFGFEVKGFRASQLGHCKLVANCLKLELALAPAAAHAIYCRVEML